MRIAYHNSWLYSEQRRAIEDSFRKRILKVICCTPTLAMGVSLPAKTVIIRNYKFFTSGRGIEPMPVFWVKQVFGRAERPEHDDYGTGIIVVAVVVVVVAAQSSITDHQSPRCKMGWMGWMRYWSTLQKKILSCWTEIRIQYRQQHSERLRPGYIYLRTRH